MKNFELKTTITKDFKKSEGVQESGTFLGAPRKELSAQYSISSENILQQ